MSTMEPRLLRRQLQSTTLVVPASPPRRLSPGSHYRTFKSMPDKYVWDAITAPVRERLAEGYRVAAVHIDWGKSWLGGSDRILHWARDITYCDAQSTFTDEWSGHGKGATTFTLERDADA